MATRPAITCGECGTALRVTDKFCTKCGTEIDWSTESGGKADVVLCRECGVPNPASNEVCRSCGSPLHEPVHAPAPRPKEVREERRTRKGDQRRRPVNQWIYFAGGMAVIAVAFFVITELRNSPKEETDQTPAAATNQQTNPTLLADIASLEKVVDADPKNTSAVLSLANALHDAKFLPRAITMYKKYLAMKPSDPNARVDMGICYFESGDSQTAKQEMEQALKYDPKHQMAMFNLGIVTLNMGDIKASNDWFKKCVAIDPTTDVAKKAQQIVQQHANLP